MTHVSTIELESRMLSSLLSLIGLESKTDVHPHDPHCPYCATELHKQGRCEDCDTLGTYVAETFTCPDCAYRLERDPVYVD